VEQAVECVIQAAKGLEYSHGQGVIHRDIKPGNLLLDQHDTIKILDMGLARLSKLPEAETRASEGLTSSGQVLGTCEYMSPEQAEDTHKADHRADIYSLGCTLYRLLTGEPPYKGETLIQILLAHQKAPIPSLCEARSDVPTELDAVYQKMMAKEPDDRYQTMGEVLDALEACLKPADSAVGGSAESSTDSALKNFLQNLPQAGAATKQKPKVLHEETMVARAEEDTAGGHAEQVFPVWKRKTWLLACVGGVSVAVLLLVVLVLVLGGGGDQEGGESPERAVAQGEEQEEHAAEATAKTPPAEPQPGEGHLLIAWPEDQRQDATLQIDGQVQDIAGLVDGADPNQLDVPLPEGSHTLWIVRRGYEPVERKFDVSAGSQITITPEWTEFAAEVAGDQTPPAMEPGEEPVAPEPSAVAQTPPPTEPDSQETTPKEKPTPVASAEIDPALRRHRELEKKYASALKPVDEKVTDWDFQAAAAALGKIQFEEDELAGRLSTRRDELERLATLKKKIIDTINSAKTPLKKSDLMLRGMGGNVSGADQPGITATVLSGKEELIAWRDLSKEATAKLLQVAIDRGSADDWLAGGLLALAAGDAGLAERLLNQARSQGADISPYLVTVAAASFARASDLLTQGQFTEAVELLGGIEGKYADTAWFASHKAAFEAARTAAKAGISEAEAEKLYADATELFKQEQLFDVRPLVEKLKSDYAKSGPVTDATRKPSFAELEQAVAELGPLVTVRQDGKGDFTSIQAAINATEPKTLIEVQDDGYYSEKLLVPKGKTGVTVRGKRGSWPVVTSQGAQEEIDVLVTVEAAGVTFERLVLSHSVPAAALPGIAGISAEMRGSDAPCLRRCVLASPVAGEVLQGQFLVEETLIIGKSAKFYGRSTNSLWLVSNVESPVGESFVRCCTLCGGLGFGNGFRQAAVDSIVLEDVHGNEADRIEFCDVVGQYRHGVKPGRGCISSPPQFRDPANLDFRLMPTSPCIGKASDGGDIGCRYTPEMIEICEKALELRAKGVLSF
jgi:hypothetical protein